MANFYKKSQSGRSMIEMLGVLAIIGVLSIGGIAGYTKAMRRHNVNELAEAVNEIISAYATIKETPNKSVSDSAFPTLLNSMLTKCKFEDDKCYTHAATINSSISMSQFYISIKLSKDICADFLGYNWHKIIPAEWGKSLRYIGVDTGPTSSSYTLFISLRQSIRADNYNMQTIAQACGHCTDKYCDVTVSCQ